MGKSLTITHYCSYLGGYSCVVLNELIFCAVFTAFVHITRDVWCCTLKLGCPRYKDHTGYLESTGYDHKGASQEEKSFLPRTKFTNRLQNVIKLEERAFT